MSRQGDRRFRRSQACAFENCMCYSAIELQETLVCRAHTVPRGEDNARPLSGDVSSYQCSCITSTASKEGSLASDVEAGTIVIMFSLGRSSPRILVAHDRLSSKLRTTMTYRSIRVEHLAARKYTSGCRWLVSSSFCSLEQTLLLRVN
jgi:hypothetical protein